MTLKSWLQRLPGIRTFVESRRDLMAIRHDVAATRRQTEQALHATSAAFVEQLLASPRYADPRVLARYELRVHSQTGEDGILAEVFRRVGTTDRFFVEFGIESGVETNTTLLLRQGWSGVWVDGDSTAVASARQRFAREIAEGRLTIIEAMVTSTNAAALMASAHVPAHFDLLSLDIDRNTYHLWEALHAYHPRVTVVEYNASFGPTADWVVDLDDAAMWDGSVVFGASLAAYARHGTQRGDALVGCTLNGSNAFFVQSSLTADHFASPFTAERHWEPPRYWLHWRGGHPTASLR
ncbi:MAG: hypothetical protein NTW72_08825 [Gemmatimonadetes bacterium]|nr:hypothetical protein [Gemmatimonadota bacterium]